MKKFAAVAIVAAALTTAAFAAPAQPFAYSATDSVVNVAYSASVDTTVRLDASKLFDSSQLIRINYGAMSLENGLRIKQVLAPDGLTVSIDTLSLNTNNGSSNLEIALTVDNNAQLSGQMPVQVVLENAMTGQTYTVNLIVNANQ
jgi:opacity protein-like surface antigen